MFKRLSLVLVALMFSLFFVSYVSAASEVKYSVESEYKLTDKTVNVTQKVAISGQSALGEQKLLLPGTTDSFSVNGSDSKVSVKPLKASVNGVKYNATELLIDLGQTQSTSLTVKYSADDLHGDYNKAESLFIPPLDFDGSISSQKLTISAPLETTVGNIIGLKPNKVSTVGGEQTYNFSSNGKINEPIVLQLGSLAAADVEVKADLKNDSFWWKTYNVILPIDTNQQKSFIKSIEPKPNQVKIDQDGNIVAVYKLWPRQQKSVVAKATVQLEQKTYDLEAEGGPEQLDTEILADYTKNTSLWPESALDELGLSAQDLRSETVIDATKMVHDKLVEFEGELSEQKDFNKRIGDEKNLTTSLDYADKMVASLRAAGIPSRLVGGVVTDNQMTKFEQSQLQAWVEVYVPNEGWMTVDPSLGKAGKAFFGQSGLQRIAMFIWGVNDHIPEFEEQSIAVSYSNKSQPDQAFGEGILSGDNFLLLPGVSLLSVKLSMPAGSIQDNIVVVADGNQVELGSLAPLQSARTFRLLFGEKSWQDIPMKLQVNGETKTQKDANLNLLGVVGVLVLVTFMVWLMIKWYKKSKAPVVLNQDDSKTDGLIQDEDLLGTNNNSQPVQQRPIQEQDRPYRLHIKDGNQEGEQQASARPAEPEDRSNQPKPPTRINF